MMETVTDVCVVIARAVGDGDAQALQPLARLEKVREALRIAQRASDDLQRGNAAGPRQRLPGAVTLLSAFLAANETGGG